MIWLMFSFSGGLKLYSVNATMSSENYTDMLKRLLLPFLAKYQPDYALFQQDGATPHRANFANQFLADQNIDVVD